MREVQAEVLDADRYAGRDPGEVLLSAVADADAVLQRLKARVAAGEVAAGDLDALGTWLDRVGRLARAAMDSGAQQRVDEANEELGHWMLGRVLAMADACGRNPDAPATLRLASYVIQHGQPPRDGEVIRA